MKIRQTNTSLGKRKVCLTCLMGLSIIQIIILVVMAVYYRMERNLYINRYKTCLSMDKCPYGLEILNEESNKTICCGNVTNYFESLVSKSISKSYDSDSNPEIGVLNLKGFDCHAYDPKLVVLKLVGINRNETQDTNGRFSRLYWTESILDTKTGLVYNSSDGSIYVEYPGAYYISFKIYINVTDCEQTDAAAASNLFTYSLHLKSAEKSPIKIYEGRNTPCELATGNSEGSVYTGASFMLGRGDTLYVETSHPQLLFYDENSHFSIHHLEDKFIEN